ncbi:MAG: alpha/beta hydrolase family protein [Acidimicrobiia bacterium]
MVHLIDRLAPLGFLLDRRSKVFAEGWGQDEHVALFGTGLTAADPLPTLDVAWGRKEEHPGFRLRRASMTSPVSDLLPHPARALTVEWIEPAQGTDRTVVLFPAWNDETFDARRKLARLLASRGIGSFIADIAFYGQRRLQPGNRPAIGSVGDFALMGYTAVAEGRALVALATESGAAGASGYSMGGNLAAYVSASMPRRIATAPLAASHGPGPVYLEGALRRAIDWKALGGRVDAVDRLRDVLGGASVLNLPSLAHHPAAVIVAAERDGWVLPEFSRDLAAHWGAELRLVHGAGHGTLLWRRKDVLADAILDSFHRIGEA